jgi:hypothetical protein
LHSWIKAFSKLQPKSNNPARYETMAEWRRALPVLVTDAHTLGSVAVIRSLGRACYPVHACSSRRDAIGFRSNYARVCAISPEEDGDFVGWLRDYVHRENIRAVIPSERVLLAIRPVFEDFATLLPSSRRPQILYAGLSKFDLFEKLKSSSQLSDHLPPTLLIPDTSQLPDATDLSSIGDRLFIKADGRYGRAPGVAGMTHKNLSAQQATRLLRELAPQFHKLLVQGHVPGQGVGVFFLIWDGEVVAHFMHRRLHEIPHTGGVSSLRESWWHPRIRDDALSKLRSLAWQGVAMMEYRWEPTSDRFYLMEMNGRFWGSLHLALYAGVDFPTLLLDSFHNHHLSPVEDFPLGVGCRHTFPMEVQYVWSVLKDNRVPLLSRLWSILEFFMLMLDPRVCSDLLFPGDRKLYWINFRRFWFTLFSNES